MKKICILILAIICLFSCKKNDINHVRSATLHFSTDTVTFDTIFASIGSITKTLKVYNHNNFDVTSNISLRGSSSAHFRMNIDGVAGNNQSGIVIPAEDSIFIFLEVTIDPSDNLTPYILTDSLIFNNGSIQQDVDLVAWGQDAYFHTANTYADIINNNDTTRFYYHLLDCSQPWSNDKPHVIYGYAIVDPGETLIINEGCQIFLHKNSGILVGNPFIENSGGTIKINGTLNNEVVFQGDRLDSWYEDIPGQWDRICLLPGSIDNQINYAIIRNGNVGIQVDTVYNSNPTVTINNTIIENMSAIGILGQGAKITAYNTIVKKCGQYSVACNIGGNYNFTHCTFANYWNYNNRNTPSLLLNNYYEGSDGNLYVRDLESANFTNCIIEGSLTTEVSFQQQESAQFNYNFNHCIIKITPDTDTSSIHYNNTLINQDVKFKDPYNNDLHITEGSPAINGGNLITNGSIDIEGNVRLNPDIGSYEFIE